MVSHFRTLVKHGRNRDRATVPIVGFEDRALPKDRDEEDRDLGRHFSERKTDQTPNANSNPQRPNKLFWLRHCRQPEEKQSL